MIYSVTSDDHNSSVDRLTGHIGATAATVQRLYNYQSAASDSDELSSGIGESTLKDHRRQQRNNSNRRRRQDGQRHVDRHAGDIELTARQQSGTLTELPASSRLQEQPAGLGRNGSMASCEYSGRQGRCKSGTDSSRLSENFYSRISDDSKNILLTFPFGISV